MTYQQHIDQLVSELDIEWVPLPDEHWTAASGSFVHSRAQFARPIGPNAQRNYWIALHELGHISRQHAQMPFTWVTFGDPRLTQKEAEAWAWALDNAIRPPGRAGLAALNRGFSSYLSNPMSYIPPDYSPEASYVYGVMATASSASPDVRDAA